MILERILRGKLPHEFLARIVNRHIGSSPVYVQGFHYGQWPPVEPDRWLLRIELGLRWPRLYDKMSLLDRLRFWWLLRKAKPAGWHRFQWERQQGVNDVLAS